MEESIESILQDYRNCVVNIMETVKKGDFDSLDDQMRIREKILSKIISLRKSKVQAKKLYNELQINKLEKELESLMKQKMGVIKQKLRSISKSKRAATAYGGMGKGFATIFSKKI